MAHLTGALPPVSVDDIVEDLRREQAAREKVYPRQIASGRLRASEADRRRRVLSAILDDLTTPGATVDVPIEERRAEIERELTMRRRLYKRWVEQRHMTLAVAQGRIRCLQGLLDLYDRGGRLL